MQLLLYIQVKATENIRFGNPFSDLAKVNSNLMLLDADNHSEELVINHQVQLLKDATEVILILDVAPNIAPGKTVRLMEKLLRQKSSSLWVFLDGQNTVIENMLKLAKTNVRSGLNQEEIYSTITRLITAN